jgi:ribonuclease BN (tRNA processing enzyme)
MRCCRMARWVTCLLFVLASFCGAQDKPANETKVILLGTGNPNTDPERSGPATAIVVSGSIYLVDCGPGIVRRAAAAKLPMEGLKRVFITHLHSDHTAGLADLILTPWVLDRTSPLEAYGPPGLKSMSKHIVAAYQEDIKMRVNGLEGANSTGYKVNAQEIQPGVVFKDANVTVKAFRVLHGSWKYAFGYRFETKDRTIVISGDTTFTRDMIEQARGVDLLIHEVYCEAALAAREPKWQRYHSSFHTASRDLARIAAEAKPRLLVLYHALWWKSSEEQLLKEIREIYKGPIAVGKDLQSF